MTIDEDISSTIPNQRKSYCCNEFRDAMATYNFAFDDNKFYICGYDMDGVYPPLNYCPNCGAKLEDYILK